MITRDEKSKIIERYEKKEEKILVSNILDKAFRFDREEKLLHTNFLNLNELKIATQVLNTLEVDWYIYAVNEYVNKKVIFFIPSYISKDTSLFEDVISCIRITPSVKGKLKHKDYMGTIYSLGLKNEMIGDIFAKEDRAYVFCMKSVASYLLNNLFKVSNQEVKLEMIPLDSCEVINLNNILLHKEYIVSSLRADAILSVIYNLSRKESKDKITKGDLCVNDKVEYNPSVILKENDIVAFRKCGKLKIGKIIRKTRSDNLVVTIYIYN